MPVPTFRRLLQLLCVIGRVSYTYISKVPTTRHRFRRGGNIWKLGWPRYPLGKTSADLHTQRHRCCWHQSLSKNQDMMTTYRFFFIIISPLTEIQQSKACLWTAQRVVYHTGTRMNILFQPRINSIQGFHTCTRHTSTLYHTLILHVYLFLFYYSYYYSWCVTRITTV